MAYGNYSSTGYRPAYQPGLSTSFQSPNTMSSRRRVVIIPTQAPETTSESSSGGFFSKLFSWKGFAFLGALASSIFLFTQRRGSSAKQVAGKAASQFDEVASPAKRGLTNTVKDLGSHGGTPSTVGSSTLGSHPSGRAPMGTGVSSPVEARVSSAVGGEATEMTVDQVRQLSPDEQIKKLNELFEKQTRGEISYTDPLLEELRENLQTDYGQLLLKRRHVDRIHAYRTSSSTPFPSEHYADKWKPFEDVNLKDHILNLEEFKALNKLKANPLYGKHQASKFADADRVRLAELRQQLEQSLTALRDRHNSTWFVSPLNDHEKTLMNRLNKWLTRFPASV